MSNMSYCRFQNTLSDFRDCKITIEDMIEGDEDGPLSREELSAAKQLAREAFDLILKLVDAGGLTMEEAIEKEERSFNGDFIESLVQNVQDNAYLSEESEDGS